MTLQGGRGLEARLKAIGQTRPLMRSIQLEVIAGAKALVPRKTGHLARSIVPGRVSDDYAEVDVNSSYAAAVEFGSRAHVIKPKRASILAWPASESGRRLSGRARTGKAAGPMIFARLVHHPGSKAQPYIIPAVHGAVGKLRDALIERWNKAS